MMAPSETLFLVGCNHHRTPLTIRERLALAGDVPERFYAYLREERLLKEAVVLNTCNRVEVYAWGDITGPERVKSLLCEVTGFPPQELGEFVYTCEGRAVVEHLYQVAAGLDSQIVGETEILGQVKGSYATATERGTVGPLLHRVFQKSFQAAKWARTHTGIGTGQVSLGNVAVDLAQRIFADLRSVRALIVGSGSLGQDVAQAFRSRGLEYLSVTSRTESRALQLAEATGGRLWPYATWKDQLSQCDIVICCTAAPGQILAAEEVEAAMRSRPGRPLFLIDLAVPRDVETGAGDVPNVFLYNFEDLAAIANENLKSRQAEVERCRTLLGELAAQTWTALQEAPAASVNGPEAN